MTKSLRNQPEMHRLISEVGRFLGDLAKQHGGDRRYEILLARAALGIAERELTIGPSTDRQVTGVLSRLMRDKNEDLLEGWRTLSREIRNGDHDGNMDVHSNLLEISALYLRESNPKARVTDDPSVSVKQI